MEKSYIICVFSSALGESEILYVLDATAWTFFVIGTADYKGLRVKTRNFVFLSNATRTLLFHKLLEAEIGRIQDLMRLEEKRSQIRKRIQMMEARQTQ